VASKLIFVTEDKDASNLREFSKDLTSHGGGAKARARGYRTTKNLITMIYLTAGKLEFNLPK